MKKKVLLILLCGICLLGLTGCGTTTKIKEKTQVKAKIVDNQKNEVELTNKELLDVHNDNEVKFEKLYNNAKIELTEDYKSVEDQGWYTCIHLKDNWAIVMEAGSTVEKKFMDIISNLEKGDKIHFTGYIDDYSTGEIKVWLVENSVFELK